MLMDPTCFALQRGSEQTVGGRALVDVPRNTRCGLSAGIMMAHRLRRWTNIIPTPGQGRTLSALPGETHKRRIRKQKCRFYQNDCGRESSPRATPGPVVIANR